MQEGAERRRIHRVLKVRVGQHDQRVLAAELEHDTLEVASRSFRKTPARRRRTREVEAAHPRVFDELVADRRGVTGCVRDDVEHAGGEPRIGEDLAPDQPAAERRLLRRLEHHGVAEHKWRGNRARREDQRGVPRRDGADDTHRAAHRHGDRTRHVRRNDLTDRCVGGTGGLPEEPGDESHLEHAEAEAAPGLAREPADDLVAPALEQVGRLEKDALTLGGGCLRPGGKGGRGCVDRTPRVGAGPGGDTSDDVAGERIEVVVACGRPMRFNPLAADEVPALAHIAVDSRGHDPVLQFLDLRVRLSSSSVSAGAGAVELS